MHSIDALSYRSRLRYRNPGVKFGYAAATLLACILSRSLLIALAVLAVNFLLTVNRGGTPALQYGRVMAVPLVFLLFSGAALTLDLSSVPLDLFALRLGKLYLTGSRESLAYALRLSLTSLAAVSCLVFLSLTTTVTDVLSVLRKLRCPGLLLELMLLIYRYIFVLSGEAHAIRSAQVSRLGNRDYRRSVTSFGMLGGALFIRSVSRSRALYDAMEARCYDGTIRVLEESRPPERRDILWIVLFEGCLVLLGMGEKLL